MSAVPAWESSLQSPSARAAAPGFAQRPAASISARFNAAGHRAVQAGGRGGGGGWRRSFSSAVL